MTELDALMEKALQRGFTPHKFRVGERGPEVLAMVYQWETCADVLVVLNDQHAHAYRMPTGKNADVFAPTDIYWWYDASAIWTLRALLTLLAPGHPDAPDVLVPAPPGSGLRR